MKSFKELAEGLNHKVPVYHADRKTLVGHVSSGATSIGAAKLAKKKSAIFSRVNGEYSWVASGDLKESKYGDAMSSRLPAHLDYPTHDKYGRSNYGKTHAKQPAAPKPKRDKEMDERLDKWDAQQQTMTEAKRQVAEPKWGKKDYDDAAERYKTMPRKGRKGFDYKKFSAYRDKNPHMFIAGLEEETHMQHIQKVKNKLSRSCGPHDQAFGGGCYNCGHDPETKKASLFGSKKGDALDRYYGSRHAAIIKAKKLEESLTPRERMSGAERLKPKEKPPVDRAQKIKQDLTQHDNVNDSVRKNLSQGGVDASANKTMRVRESEMAFDESGGGYQVGDKVVPKIGPHKGTTHTVIHVHPTGHLNIKPDVHVRSNRYHLGAAKADPKDVERAPLKESSSDGMSFHKAIHHAKAYGNRVTYGTASRKWHSIDSKDRDFHTSFALDPDEAHRQGEAKSLLHSTQSRHLEEASSKRSFYADKQERDPAKWLKNRGKQFKKWPDEMRTTNTGINRKTIQEVFQAAKDKKAGKQDNLPQSQEGANEPGKEKFDAPTPQPQGQGGDAPKTQDGGAPGAQEKKNNTPKPEASKNAKKLVPKGGEQFQADPYVTPLTTMPDTASPKSGSQGVR